MSTVLCADARVLMEQYFIERLREAGYKDMLMRNNALCKDTRRRAQMARWRAAHPGYMSAAARRHKELREQKLREQQQAQAETVQEERTDGRRDHGTVARRALVVLRDTRRPGGARTGRE